MASVVQDRLIRRTGPTWSYKSESALRLQSLTLKSVLVRRTLDMSKNANLFFVTTGDAESRCERIFGKDEIMCTLFKI